MEKCGSDGEAGDTIARRMYIVCRYTAPCSRPYKNGSMSNPKIINSSNDRLFAVGRIVGGWIYSKPVGWLVCLLLSVVWSDLWSVVGLRAGLFAIRSVGRLNHLDDLLQISA